MAVLRRSPPSIIIVLIITTTSLLRHPPPVHSLTCSSQKLTPKRVYSNCTDLPTLNSTLHWTYSGENATLTIAFASPPVTPNGWVAWAINPTSTGMAGSQTLIAFKDSNGTMTVKTYNISSYSSIVEGKIAFEVADSSAEFSGGVMVIFATVKLPEMMTEVNQVWQVGGSVVDGRPAKHEFLPANLNAMGKLRLVGGSSSATGGNATVAGGPAVAPSSSWAGKVGRRYGALVVVVCLLLRLF